MDDMNKEAMDERILERMAHPHRGKTISSELQTTRVWRVLNLDDGTNEALLNIIDTDSGKYTIVDVLFKHVLNGDIDACLEPLNPKALELSSILRYRNILDTSKVFKVDRLVILEDRVYDDKTHVVRKNILSVALLYSLNNSTKKLLFWVLYQDLLGAIDGYFFPGLMFKTKGTKRHSASLTEYFEFRLFESKLID